MADDAADEIIVTEAPKRDKNGVELYGKYPVNHGLRAEALARAGKKEDPDGIIEPDLIADYAKRIGKVKPEPTPGELKDATATPSTAINPALDADAAKE